MVLKEELQCVLSHTQTPTTLVHEKLNDLVKQENGLVRNLPFQQVYKCVMYSFFICVNLQFLF